MIKRYFTPEGLLKDVFHSYEYRVEQLSMAEAVMRSIEKKSTLIVEAGTGVGKSLAYLIPICSAVLDGQIQRAIVSTYTKALQRQLVEKDLPLIKENLMPDVTYRLCLGSENYLCKRRLSIAVDTGNVDIFEEDDFKRLLKWKETTEEGLLLELSPPLSLWKKVCRESDLCHGRDCTFFDECLYQKAKRMERQSHILVANHHLLFTHIATGWNVLPEFDAIVFDEAHEIEDVATDYLGMEISNTVLRYILDSIVSPRGRGYLMRLKKIEASKIKEITDIVGRLRNDGERFFNTLSMTIDSGRAKKLTINRQLISLKNDLSDALQELEQSLRQIGINHDYTEEWKDLRAMADRCRSFRDTMDIIIEQPLEEHVYWASVEGRKIRAIATPIELGGILNAQLFQIIDRVVLTSATLTVEGSFGYLKERLGIEDAETLCLMSPFEYEKQVCLYIPDNIPDPQDDGYIEVISNEINRIIEHTGGRTLLLFTSYSMLDSIAERINMEKIRILRQGDRDSYALIEEFKRTERALLLGTYTFWQGIDIPGDALQCVVITKLPFSVPTDPVVEARMEALLKKGMDPFYSYQVPDAVIKFRQGFGRLIRTSEDSGLVAILDSRILKRRYGLTFLKSLPRMRIIKDLSEYYVPF